MRYKVKKTIVWIGIILVAFIAVALVMRTVFNYTNGKKLEKFLGQMKSEGIPLTIKDIEPQCNPRDNAAIDWKAAEAILRQHEEAMIRIRQLELAGKSFADTARAIMASNGPPEMADTMLLLANESNREALQRLQEEKRKITDELEAAGISDDIAQYTWAMWLPSIDARVREDMQEPKERNLANQKVDPIN